jgi:hypothetical protein
MQTRMRIAGAIIVLGLCAAVVLYTLAPTILGFVAKASGRTSDFGLTLTVSPTGPVTPETPILLTARSDEKLVAIHLTAQQGSCEVKLKVDDRKGFAATFTPLETGCGEGAYTIRARGIGLAGNQQTVARTLTVANSPPPQPTTYSGDLRVTSSNAYPPAAGSSLEQVVVIAPLGPTVQANEVYSITGDVVMTKESRGTFDGEYRLVRGDGTVLLTRTVTDPTTPTADSFSTTVTMPEGGSTDTIQLEFRATSQFSAIRIDKWSMTIVRTT